MRSDLLRSIGTTAIFLLGGGALGVLAILGARRRPTSAADAEYWRGYEDCQGDLGGGPLAPR